MGSRIDRNPHLYAKGVQANADAIFVPSYETQLKQKNWAHSIMSFFFPYLYSWHSAFLFLHGWLHTIMPVAKGLCQNSVNKQTEGDKWESCQQEKRRPYIVLSAVLKNITILCPLHRDHVAELGNEWYLCIDYVYFLENKSTWNFSWLQGKINFW